MSNVGKQKYVSNKKGTLPSFKRISKFEVSFCCSVLQNLNIVGHLGYLFGSTVITFVDQMVPLCVFQRLLIFFSNPHFEVRPSLWCKGDKNFVFRKRLKSHFGVILQSS